MVFFGSCLWLLCYAILPKSPKANLDTCWEDILKTYKEKGIVERYRGMTKLTLFNRKKGGPKLKGRAAQIQAFAEPMQFLWAKHSSPDVDVHRKIKTWLNLNVKVERILKDNQDQLALQGDDYLKFKGWSFAMAQIHRHLSQHFADEGLPLFSDIPKIHCWLHSVLASQFLNPRLTWCFRQEDNMNARRTLAQSCCRGIRGPQVTAKMVAKMRIALHLQLDKM